MMLHLPRIAAALSAACLLLASCSKEDTPPVPPHVRPEVADQTVMLFLAGNNNLLPNFINNIKDAQRFVSANTLYDCRLLAFIQPAANLAAVLELSYDHEQGGCVIDTLRKWEDPAFCSADSERITEVLGYMAEQAPAKRYGLIMGSHGTGWVPAQYMSLSFRSPDADFWKKAEGAYETRWFGTDKNRATDIPALATSLTALRSQGVKLDYLIFDACFMGNIETFYDLRGCADYLLGSPCEIMSHGFPYEQTMPYLLADEGKSCDLAGVCRSFFTYYDTQSSVRSGCITMAVSSELEALAATMKRVNAGARKSYDRNALQRYEGLSSPLFIDLGDYVEASCDDPALLKAFYGQMERTFPTRYHTPQFYSAYDRQLHTISVPDERWYGVTVSEPSLKYRTENQQTAWYQATH